MSSTAERIAIPPEIYIDDELTLRQLSLASVEPMYELLVENRPFLSKTMSWVNDWTYANAWEEQRVIDQETRDGRAAAYGILEHDQLQGAISLSERHGKSAEMGYWLAEAATRKLIATRAARTLLEFGFEDWGLDTVDMHILGYNLPSIKTAQKLGARYTGASLISGRDGWRYMTQRWRVNSGR